MTPEETLRDRLRDGRLEECLSLVQDQVRQEPANPRPRIFLFQLQAILGQWQRALNQLQVLGDLDQGGKLSLMIQTYREAIKCEALRAEIFAGKRSPVLFGEPEAWTGMMLKALQLSAAGQSNEAEGLRGEALEMAPASTGTINDQKFAWVADADTRLGPMFEVITQGNYYWLPVHRVRAIRFEAPADLRDLVWLPAFVTLANGGELPALMPARYPGSEGAGDPLVRLGRRTEWVDGAGGGTVGMGQRMLATDQAELALLEVRSLQIDEAAGTAVGGA
ncbi:MAG TPA: type VI secretion system accessory protein TagJ [Polyangia bacterium]